MNDPLTTITLVFLTLLALAGAVAAIRRLLRGMTGHGVGFALMASGLCAAGAAGLFVYRWIFVNHDWQPLDSHVDGLILIAALLAASTCYLGGASRMPGIAAFALPLLALLLAWGVCASWFTFAVFHPLSMVLAVHLGGVYLGTLFFAVAAVAGGMYLFLQHRARKKTNLAGNTRLPSLEAAERLIVHASALGFALLTVGLVSGLIIVTTSPDNPLGAGWWHHPKVVLAACVWVIYALVMNVRHATHFRGSRAAWLSVAGFVLILAVFAIVQLLSTSEDQTVRPTSPAHAAVSGEAGR